VHTYNVYVPSIAEIIFEALWLFGILSFAISGALVGVRKNLDLLGVLVVGTATGIGGGIIRDIIVGHQPPVSLVEWQYWSVALTGSLIVFYFHPSIAKIRKLEIIFDAIGLGVFAAHGAAVATASGLGIVPSIFVGTITAIGGGVVRDVLVTDVPGVLTRELYAVSAIVGATIATVIVVTSSEVVVASVVGGVVAVTLRLVSYKFGWHLPKPKIVTD